ncbi:hypothetical protein PVAP13_7NG347200 [Panicum virgatum]|uniref:Late embryogenesis abundant protein LEA-2 subgroup domain-containing protein n=1 Tax=Panicum virgatum TaxID=38727 RepID=A0A8T0Q7M3_PANVG|nr:hypothetical protein PVAP13_7NG347200 [Panicum virgatum]
MVAKPHGDDCVVVVGCPPTTAYGGSHGREASTAQEEGSSCGRRTVLAWIFAAVAITAFVLLAVFLSRKFPDGQPRYSVAVAAVAGLDPARDLSARGRLTISPVFNVTVHVDNTRSAVNEACVEELATAVVSYGDAFLGRGTVPAFCAPRRRRAEAVARAWGQEVAVPWFLRDELAAGLAAGEATVDVKLAVPWVIVCKAKVGGGLSRCGV